MNYDAEVSVCGNFMGVEMRIKADFFRVDLD